MNTLLQLQWWLHHPSISRQQRAHLCACWGGTWALRPTQRSARRGDTGTASLRCGSARAASGGWTFWRLYYNNCIWNTQRKKKAPNIAVVAVLVQNCNLHYWRHLKQKWCRSLSRAQRKQTSFKKSWFNNFFNILLHLRLWQNRQKKYLGIYFIIFYHFFIIYYVLLTPKLVFLP